MSDVMLFGVLRMPYEMAMSDDLSRVQFHQRAQQAADRIEVDADHIEQLEQQNAKLREVLEDARNTVLWLERRLPNGYGEVPHVKRTIATLNAAISAAPAASQQAKVTERLAEPERQLEQCIASVDEMESLIDEDIRRADQPEKRCSVNRRQNPKREVEIWNGRVKVGDLVEYRSYPEAEPQLFKTRTEAQVLSGHTSVVWLEGKSGCVCTSACRLAKSQGASE